jgi:hypothetical protein
MLILSKERACWAECLLPVRMESGAVEEVAIRLRYRIPNAAELISGGIQPLLPERALVDLEVMKRHAQATQDYFASFLRGVILDWSGVGDASGVALPFTTENLDILLGWPGVAAHLFEKSFTEILKVETPEKNSKTPGGATPSAAKAKAAKS